MPQIDSSVLFTWWKNACSIILPTTTIVIFPFPLTPALILSSAIILADHRQYSRRNSSVTSLKSSVHDNLMSPLAYHFLSFIVIFQHSHRQVFHIIMHRTMGLTCYIGPLTLTLVRSSVSHIVLCIIKCNRSTNIFSVWFSVCPLVLSSSRLLLTPPHSFSDLSLIISSCDSKSTF